MSVAEVNRPIAVPERVIIVMAMLTKAADAGELCPTNDEIAGRLKASSGTASVNALALLETMGLILIKRFHASRVVTIVSTGRSTAYPRNDTPHWRGREGALGTPCRKPGPIVRDMAQSARFLTETDIAARRVNRDPCPYCGTRGDIGCRHNPAQAAA